MKLIGTLYTAEWFCEKKAQIIADRVVNDSTKLKSVTIPKIVYTSRLVRTFYLTRSHFHTSKNLCRLTSHRSSIQNTYVTHMCCVTRYTFKMTDVNQ